MLSILVLFVMIMKTTINVKVSGTVEFGPDWLLEAFHGPNDDNTVKDTKEHVVGHLPIQKEKERHINKKKKVTKDKFHTKSKDNNEINKKNKETIEKFSNLVYDQTVKVFKKLKKAIRNQELRKETELAEKIYKDQFRNYLKAVKDLKSSSLDRKKIITTTIQTSSGIVRKLVEDIKGYSKKQQNKIRTSGLIRGNHTGKLTSSDIINKDMAIIEELLKNEVESEYQLACQEFNACRSDPVELSFKQFAIDCMSKAITVNDLKLRNAHYMVIRVVKKIQFTKIVDEELNALIHVQNDYISQWQSGDIRPGYELFLKRLRSGERPTIIINGEPQTVAALTLIDSVNPRIPATNDIIQEWTDMKIIVSEWAEDLRSDIKDIVKMIVYHVLDNTRNETLSIQSSL